jgi:type IV secretion system protein VirD4
MKAQTTNRGWRVVAVALLVGAVLALGWPAAFVAVHGWSADGWPLVAGMATPRDWYQTLLHADLVTILGTYAKMATGQSAAFADGGTLEGVVLAGVTFVYVGLLLGGGQFKPLRDESGVYGNSDWAPSSDLAKMTAGLELGINPTTQRAVRVQIEGNLVTIAPPRSGKTDGFVIPNLAFPEPNAWAGPSVVIDPKGDAYKAVRRRRTELGKTVRCLDPLNYVGGADRWNPLLRISADDVLYLQSMALALLPQTKESTDAGAYFRSRAVDLMVGALQCSILEGRADPVRAAELLLDEAAFVDALKSNSNRPAARAALAIMVMEDRSRDGIISTVQEATQWLRDARLRAVVQDHTFELSDLAEGDADLFIVLPADERKHIIAPYVRWLLADLFESVRKNRPAERIVAFIDEAHVLGRFDAILQGAGELPGYGISLWTIWQSRFQIEETYGKNGAEILLGTSEVTNVFDLPAVQPEELERWSQAIGTFTGVKTSTTTNAQSGQVTHNSDSMPRRLVAATDLPEFLKDWQVVFLTSKKYTRKPIKLRRTVAHSDRRFEGLIEGVPPVGTTK